MNGIENELELIGKNAKNASRILAKMDVTTKNEVLTAVADALIARKEFLMTQNRIDLVNAEKNGMAPALACQTGRSSRGSDLYEETSERTSDRSRASTTWSDWNYL